MTAQKAGLLRSSFRRGKYPPGQASAIYFRNAVHRSGAHRNRAEGLEAEKRLNVTFSEVFSQYLATLDGGHRKSTESRYRTHLQEPFGSKPLREIRPLDLERFKSHSRTQNLSEKTISHDLSINIRTVFKKAVSWGLFTGKLPTDDTAFPKLNNKRMRYLSTAEAHTLLNALQERSPQTHDQALLALQCGLRGWGDP